MATMCADRRQFDLFLLLEWIAAIAFLAALLSGAGSKSSWTTEFASLPADDTALEAWLNEHEYGRVRLSRDDSSITLQKETRLFPFATFEQLPNPPWQELGYPAPNGKRGSINWTLFHGSSYLWIVGFGILIGLGQLRRWGMTRRKTNVENCDE